jgi:tetratricopeptide (TPR) repeat protein
MHTKAQFSFQKLPLGLVAIASLAAAVIYGRQLAAGYLVNRGSVAFLRRGYVEMDTGRCPHATSALALLDAALMADPTLAVVHWGRARILACQGSWDEAAWEIRTAESLGYGAPTMAAWLERQGERLERVGREEEAGRAYLTSAQMYPHWPRTWILIGRWYRRLGKTDQAMAAFQRSISIGGHDSDYATIELAQMEVEVGSPSAAQEVLAPLLGQAGLPLDVYAGVHYWYGESMREQGRLTEALEHFGLVVDRVPGGSDVWFVYVSYLGLARTHEELGRLDLALENCCSAVEAGLDQEQRDEARRLRSELMRRLGWQDAGCGENDPR